MSFIYPRTVSILRPTAPTGTGLQSYGAQASEIMVQIASAARASIQLKKEVGTPPAGLPADVSRRTYWQIFMPRLPLGTVQDRDIIVDDQDIRYQVTAAYWNSLGFNCLCERLES